MEEVYFADFEQKQPAKEAEKGHFKGFTKAVQKRAAFLLETTNTPKRLLKGKEKPARVKNGGFVSGLKPAGAGV